MIHSKPFAAWFQLWYMKEYDATLSKPSFSIEVENPNLPASFFMQQQFGTQWSSGTSGTAIQLGVTHQEHHQKHPETFVPTGSNSPWLPLAHRPMSSHAFRWPLASLPRSRTSASRWAQGSVGLKAPSLIWHNMSHEYWSLVRLYFGDIIVDNLCWYRTYSIYIYNIYL